MFGWVLLILGWNGLFSSKCNFVLTLFYGENPKDVLRLADFGLFWAEMTYFLQSATFYTLFSESKSGKILCVWRIVAWFERKKVIHCHAQPYSPTFRNRKGAQKIFAAQTPQRKRGFFSTHQTIVGKISKRLRNLLSSLADAPHCSMGLVSKLSIDWHGSTLMPCHAAVCVNFILSAKVQFSRVIMQSTGLAFPTGSLSRDDYGWMLVLCLVGEKVQVW